MRMSKECFMVKSTKEGAGVDKGGKEEGKKSSYLY